MSGDVPGNEAVCLVKTILLTETLTISVKPAMRKRTKAAVKFS